MAPLTFSAMVERLPGDELWTVLVMPFDAERVQDQGLARPRHDQRNSLPRSIHPRDDGLQMLSKVRAAGMVVGAPEVMGGHQPPHRGRAADLAGRWPSSR
jgi:hypothetical protein